MVSQLTGKTRHLAKFCRNTEQASHMALDADFLPEDFGSCFSSSPLYSNSSLLWFLTGLEMDGGCFQTCPEILGRATLTYKVLCAALRSAMPI